MPRVPRIETRTTKIFVRARPFTYQYPPSRKASNQAHCLGTVRPPHIERASRVIRIQSISLRPRFRLATSHERVIRFFLFSPGSRSKLSREVFDSHIIGDKKPEVSKRSITRTYSETHEKIRRKIAIFRSDEFFRSIHFCHLQPHGAREFTLKIHRKHRKHTPEPCHGYHGSKHGRPKFLPERPSVYRYPPSGNASNQAHCLGTIRPQIFSRIQRSRTHTDILVRVLRVSERILTLCRSDSSIFFDFSRF